MRVNDESTGQQQRAVDQRRLERAPAALTPRDNLLRRMRLVAKARFAANRRLEAKGSATNLGLQIANLYTIAIGIFLIQFPSDPAVRIGGASLNYVSLLASVFVQIMALIETYKDYGGKAKRMHDCAVVVNNLAQRLEINPREGWDTLEHYRKGYEAAIKDASANHDDLDYRAAQLEPARWRRRSREEKWTIIRWKIAYLWNVYVLTATILASPIAMGCLLVFYGVGSLAP